MGVLLIILFVYILAWKLVVPIFMIMILDKFFDWLTKER